MQQVEMMEDENNENNEIIDEFKWTMNELTILDIYDNLERTIYLFPEVKTYLLSIIPDFTCSEARHGLVKIKINNFDDLCQFKSPYPMSGDDWHFHVDSMFPMFRVGFIFKHNGLSYTINIENGDINNEGELFIKFPTYYISYDVDIWLQANNDIIIDVDYYPQQPSKYSFVWPKSDIQTLHISSFLSYDHDEYKINEMESKKLNFLFMIDDKLFRYYIKNTYQVNYNYYGDNKQIGISVMNEMYPKIASRVINLNRVLNQGIYQNKYIEIRNKSEFDLIVTVLWNYFENDRYFGDPLDDGPCSGYSQSMQYFVINNICEFLFEFEYHYKVNCILNGSDGILRFGNIMDIGILNLKIWQCTLIHRLIPCCDCCGVQLDEFDFVFSCVGKRRQHIICTDCINTTIESYQEINQFNIT